MHKVLSKSTFSCPDFKAYHAHCRSQEDPGGQNQPSRQTEEMMPVTGERRNGVTE